MLTDGVEEAETLNDGVEEAEMSFANPIGRFRRSYPQHCKGSALWSEDGRVSGQVNGQVSGQDSGQVRSVVGSG